MYPPILCTCGKSLGVEAYWYAIEKKKEMIKYCESQQMGQVAPEFLPLMEGEGFKMGHVLDELHVKKSCCRDILLTNVCIKDM